MIFIPILFLLGGCSLSVLMNTFACLGRIQSEDYLTRNQRLYFFYFWIQRLTKKNSWVEVIWFLHAAKYVSYILYALTSILMMPTLSTKGLIISCIVISLIPLILEVFLYFLSSLNALLSLQISTPFNTLLLLCFAPVILPLFFAKQILTLKRPLLSLPLSSFNVKDKILEFVNESELSPFLEPVQKRLITSIASFSDHIVREIMVPRIDVFALSIDQTVHEAAQQFIKEGYSRIPVYQNNLDTTIGVLLYKDVMEYYFRSIENKEASPLKTPLKKLVKPVLYTPETKKIAVLLQEIKQKQIHLALVVDEYGSTEGIITTEDILEELVGEIADEYDVIEEETLYSTHTAGGWIVDAKMNLLDIQKELGILIPKSREYDTIGGYVFHRAGTIPSKGWRLHTDLFDLEVLNSTERTIEKVIIMPSIKKAPNSHPPEETT